MAQRPLYVGIDVGTGSVRAGIYNDDGQLLGQATKDTQTWRSESDHRIFEQSTTDIWEAICYSVQQANGYIEDRLTEGVLDTTSGVRRMILARL